MPTELIFAPDVNSGSYRERPDGSYTNEKWHQDAIADTGDGYVHVGRPHIIQCAWCPKAFAAGTLAGALEMYRAHEDSMLKQPRKGLSSLAICPDCRAGKHRSCNETALDEATDEIVACACPEHSDESRKA